MGRPAPASGRDVGLGGRRGGVWGAPAKQVSCGEGHGKPGFVQEAREVPSGCVPSWSLTRLAWDARGLKAP